MTDTFKDQLLHGMTIRESATDGSDFTNPAADYRRLFLGEDGLLHLKDSAGAVTDIASSGNVATDSIWDAAGDLAVGSGANTAAKLTLGAAGGHLSRINGAVAWDSGTSFPGAAAADDRYYRSDRNIEYFYDGTRWLSVKVYRGAEGVLVASTTTSGQVVVRFAPWHTTYDLWLESLYSALYVATTNTGSAYWTVAFVKYQSNFSTSSTAGSVNTSANSANVVVTAETAIGALFDPSTYKMAQIEATKTGSPGALSIACAVSYRLVG